MVDRRTFLTSAAGALLVPQYASAQRTSKPGIPGPFPGRVAAVEHSGIIAGRKYNQEAVTATINKGMMELTGAPSPQDAWRMFVQPGDVVGIKLNPVGRPFVISSPEVVRAIISGVQSAGVPLKNIVAYDRYKREFEQAGFDKWLPEGMRWTSATNDYDDLQLDMAGYDRDQYVEMPLVLPQADPANPHHRRSYLSNFISKEVNKLVNLCLLKHHQSAGVTLALKNLSHGLVNNVSRSHSSSSLNACGTFIPNIVDHPIIRQKVVVNILDGALGAWHGGPGRKVEKYVWEHRTMYFSTDPVAMDHVGWKAIDAKRASVGVASIADAKPDPDSQFVRMQPEHVEIAGTLGLGIWDEKKMDVRRLKLA
jgi:uncharacterized protein (DUF362 family)